MTKLQSTIGYSFKDINILKTALTHSSYANEVRGSKLLSNERMEFLGDSLLSLFVSSHIYNITPALPEGQMTRLRAQLVCEDSLYNVALEINLGEELFFGKGEKMTGGSTRPSILADAVEALIAALYLDGGLEPVREFIHKYILQNVCIETATPGRTYDAKTKLQELVQQKSGRVLAYEIVREEGPDHNKHFVVDAIVDGKVVGHGSGRTKKEAEQAAAFFALEENML